MTCPEVDRQDSNGGNQVIMDDLKQCSLDELIDVVIQERLVDSCELYDDHVIVVQGSMRFVLNPVRAHAFLRGVIKGMSVRYRRRWACNTEEPEEAEAEPMELLKPELPQSGLIDSFRRHLLKKWWSRYEEAKSPFGPSSTGLMLWVRHNTNTTTN